MATHLQRGIVIITQERNQDLTDLDDYFMSSYAYEEWAIAEEAEREERAGIETFGPHNECIAIVRVFYAYDVPKHLTWAGNAATEKYGTQVVVRLEQEDVSEAEYAAAQRADEFKSPYWQP